MKKLLALFMALVTSAVTLTSCGMSNVPCENCESTPTKGYKNEYTGETEYYCESCSSNCTFCSNEATTYYTSALGIIVFVCDDCKEYIQDINN